MDVVAFVPALPEHGGDVLAEASETSAAGAFNVLAAAARHGMRAGLVGRHGTGPNGDRIRGAFHAEHIELLLPPTEDGDTGFCIGLVDASGERTYVTVPGVDGSLTDDDLDGVVTDEGDVVYLSGYELAFAHGRTAARWFTALPDGVTTVFDPGPLVASLRPHLLEPVLRRATWLSLNERESHLMTGLGPAAAAQVLLRDHPSLAGVIVRTGPDGCWLVTETDGVGRHVPVPGGPRRAVDTTGAGDCHVGTFIASLAEGFSAVESVQRANLAAALSVTRRGPATAPPRVQLDLGLHSSA